MLREIERGIIRLPFVLQIDRLVFTRDARDVVLIEGTVLEFGGLECAFGLADQMIDLVGSDPIDFEFDHWHAARTDRKFVFAA